MPPDRDNEHQKRKPALRSTSYGKLSAEEVNERVAKEALDTVSFCIRNLKAIAEHGTAEDATRVSATKVLLATAQSYAHRAMKGLRSNQHSLSTLATSRPHSVPLIIDARKAEDLLRATRVGHGPQGVEMGPRGTPLAQTPNGSISDSPFGDSLGIDDLDTSGEDASDELTIDDLFPSQPLDSAAVAAAPLGSITEAQDTLTSSAKPERLQR